MLAAQAAGLRTYCSQPLQSPHAPPCGVRLQCLASPSLVQRCPHLRSGPKPGSPRARARPCETCSREAFRVAARATSTAERIACEPATAGWRSKQPSLEDSWDERWSQVDTAAAAAAIWRQRPAEPSQQAQLNEHDSGGSAPWPSTGSSGVAGGLSSARSQAVSGVQDAPLSSSVHPLHGDHIDFGANGSSDLSTAAAAGRNGREAEYARMREQRRSAWAADTELPEHERQRRINISKNRVGRAPWNKGLGEPKLPIEERLKAQGLPDAEIARRKKISEGAKGRVPWNKGKKHSAEWREKIKVGTLAAMQRPEVLDKVRCTKRRHLMPPKKEKPAPKPKREPKPRATATTRRRPLPAAQALPEAASLQDGLATSEDGAGAQQQEQQGKRPAYMSQAHRDAIAAAIRRKWQDPEYRSKVESRMRAPEYQQQRIEKWREHYYAPERVAHREQVQAASQAEAAQAPRARQPRRKALKKAVSMWKQEVDHVRMLGDRLGKARQLIPMAENALQQLRAQAVTSPEAAATVQSAQQEAGTVLAAAKAQAADLEAQLEAAQASLDAGQAEAEARAAEDAAVAAQQAVGATSSEAEVSGARADSSSSGSEPAGPSADGTAAGSGVLHGAPGDAATAAPAAPDAVKEPLPQAGAGSASGSGHNGTPAAPGRSALPWQGAVPAAAQQPSPAEAAAERHQQRVAAHVAGADAVSEPPTAAAEPSAAETEAPQRKRWVWENGRRVRA